MFDFSYTDDDVKQLRKQMLMQQPGSAPQSATRPVQRTVSPPSNRRSIPRSPGSSSASSSSLSDIESQQPPPRKQTSDLFSDSALSDDTTNDQQDADGEVDDADEDDDVFFRESVGLPSKSSSSQRPGSRSITTGRKPSKGRSKATTVESSSSSSDEEGDQPLASRLAAASAASNGRTIPGKRTSKMPGGHAGKKAKKAHHTVAGTAPAHFGPGEGGERIKASGARPMLDSALVCFNSHLGGATGGMTNGNIKLKVEDKMDEGQLSRLAAGVAVDPATATAPKVSH